MHHDVIQLFDPASFTFTYFLVDRASHEAVVIDSVDLQLERDLALIERLSLKVRYIVETHAHADHVTGAGRLRERTGAEAAAPAGCGIEPAELQLLHGDTLRFGGSEQLLALHTPGHTAGSMCYVFSGNVFTGDTLLIDGCGRTDFQSGDAGALYDSVHARLFSLPDDTRVYPGHDYRGNTVSTIGHEKRRNARLANCDRDAFIAKMAKLELPRPRLIDVAVPANRQLGIPHGG
ncbi:MAG TPA: MBL fold metallo-hydrolase [Casimicrobiaceae bacterium]|nr:MBL fold metallo-hydrolase [Casimicrobiaceae bacterium]